MAKNIRTITAGFVTAAAVIVFGTTLVHAVWYAPDSEVTPPDVQQNILLHHIVVATSSAPARLIIPALHINAAVQHVGVTARGNLGTPSNFTDVAWYKYGAVPGQAGSAVIDGHVDNGLGLDGVFKHLSDLKAGDDIYVTDSGGKKLHFVVSETATYPYDSVPTGLLFSRTDEARLNLITCGGTWVPQDKTYNERMIIYATLVTG